MGSVVRAKVQEVFQRSQSFSDEWRISAVRRHLMWNCTVNLEQRLDHISFKRNSLSLF